MKKGQEVTWKFGSFGFREAIRKCDPSAIEALENLVGQMFVEVNVLDGDEEGGEFYFTEDNLEWIQQKVVDDIGQYIAAAADADRKAKKEQDEEARAEEEVASAV